MVFSQLIALSKSHCLNYKYLVCSECGLRSCHPPRPGYINVHLVPHSHDDTGWLKTVDQYYYGSHQRVYRAGVQYIIESVVKELASDPDKRFIQVETGFFWRWWEDKDEFTRNVTRSLVEAGQLVFTGGGWSMNDEAATHYTSIIDNMETGLNWLVDNLGECAVPDIAWQIDPFGHSKEQAKIFAEMGFNGLFFARIDYRDNEARKVCKCGGKEESLMTQSPPFSPACLTATTVTPPGSVLTSSARTSPSMMIPGSRSSILTRELLSLNHTSWIT